MELFEINMFKRDPETQLLESNKFEKIKNLTKLKTPTVTTILKQREKVQNKKRC